MRALRHRRKSRIGVVLLAMTMVVGSAAGLWLSASASSAQSGSAQAVTTQSASSPDVEVLAAALAITTHASALVNDNAEPTTLRTNPQSLGAVAAANALHEAELMAQLGNMSGKGYDERVARITELVNQLLANSKQLTAGRGPILQAAYGNVQLQRTMSANGYPLLEAVYTSLDEEYFGLMDGTVRWDLRDDIRLFVEKQRAEISIGAMVGFVNAVTLLTDPSFLGIARESQISAENYLRNAIEYIYENDRDSLDAETYALAEWLLNVGDEAFFVKEANRLSLVAAELDLIEANAVTLARLLDEVNALRAVVVGQDPPRPLAPPVVELPPPGVTDTEVHFGQTAALSGSAASLGSGMKLGIEAAFAEVNRSGGVHGRQLRLTTLDDRYESQIAFENTLNLLQAQRVFGMIGTVGTPTARGAAPVAGGAGAPFIGPLTGADFLREADQDHVVHYRASYYQETEQMVNRLVEDLGVTRVGVVYQNDSYGLDGLEGVRRALARHDLEVVESAFYRRNTAGIKGAAFEVSEANPEAVIIISAHAAAAEAVRLLRDIVEPDPVLMAVSFVDSAALAEDLGDEGEGVYVTQIAPLPYDFDSRAVRNYRDALMAHDPDASPGFVSLEGYIVGRMAIAGLEACGADLTRECFLGAFNGDTDIRIDELKLTFGPDDNQGSNKVQLSRLGSDGRFHYVSRVTR